MGVIAVSITKEATWNGEPERFSNIYHYSEPGFDFGQEDISESDARALVDQLVSVEVPIFASSVDFVEARVWGPTDGPAQDNNTIGVFDLSENGSGSRDSYMCLEDCILIRFECERESMRGRKVYLRKWLRTMCQPGYTDGFTAEQHARREPAFDASLPELTTYANAITQRTLVELSSFPDQLTLSSPSGRVVVSPGSPEYEVSRFLETHDVKY